MKKSTLILFFSLMLGICFAQNKVMSYTDMKAMLPGSLNGYTALGDAEGTSMTMGGMSYTMATREYKKGDAFLTVVLMDYSESVMLFQQATMMWNQGMSIEDDDQKAGTVTVAGQPGWEVFEKNDNEAQVIVGKNDRFLLTVNLTKQSNTANAKEVMNKVVGLFP